MGASLTITEFTLIFIAIIKHSFNSIAYICALVQ